MPPSRNAEGKRMRTLLALVIAVVLSVFIAYFSAWTCALYAPIHAVQGQPGELGRLTGSIDQGESRSVEFDGVEVGFGVQVVHPVTVMVKPASGGSGVSVSTVQTSGAHAISAGWPMHSLTATLPRTGVDVPDGAAGLEAPSWAPPAIAGRRLPTSPIWKGLGINIAILVVMIWPTLAVLIRERSPRAARPVKAVDLGQMQPEPLVSSGPLMAFDPERTSKQSGAA